MSELIHIDAADRQLLDEISATMAEAVRRGGDWIVCRPGCTQCCIGPFPITPLDARRLRAGLSALEFADPDRAAAVRRRANEYILQVASVYPGNPVTGDLPDEDSLPDSLDDLPCPALDPVTGCCDLYDSRPITCRTFGPATLIADQTLGACELCFEGATEQEMLDCAVEADPEGHERTVLESLAAEGVIGMTIVAFALSDTNVNGRESL